MHSAVSTDHVHIIKYLLEKDADPNVSNARGNYPINFARFRDNHVEIADIMIQYGADVTKICSTGEMSYVMAAYTLNLQDVIDVFEKHGLVFKESDIILENHFLDFTKPLAYNLLKRNMFPYGVVKLVVKYQILELMKSNRVIKLALKMPLEYADKILDICIELPSAHPDTNYILRAILINYHKVFLSKKIQEYNPSNKCIGHLLTAGIQCDTVDDKYPLLKEWTTTTRTLKHHLQNHIIKHECFSVKENPVISNLMRRRSLSKELGKESRKQD